VSNEARLTRALGPGAAKLKRIASLDGRGLRVGAMGEGGGPSPLYRNEDGTSGPPVATILLWHEYGLGVPERSVIRATLASRKRELAERTSVAAARVAGGVSVDRALEQVGRWLSGAFGRRILEGITPGLAPATLAQRFPRVADVPLAKTGQILQLVRSMRMVAF
jgi:hypothetical protein